MRLGKKRQSNATLIFTSGITNAAGAARVSSHELLTPLAHGCHCRDGVSSDAVAAYAVPESVALASEALAELVRALARRTARQRSAEARRQVQQAHGQTAGQPDAVG